MDNEIKQSRDQITTTSVHGQPVPVDVLEELETGKQPEHFVTLEIEGKMAHGIYLTKEFQPTTQDKAELLKVMFEDGSVSFFTVNDAEQHPAPTYPDDHQAAMQVPKGGSACSKCVYVSKDHTRCSNKHFVAWNNGSPILPLPADEYCSDWFEAAEGTLSQQK